MRQSVRREKPLDAEEPPLLPTAPEPTVPEPEAPLPAVEEPERIPEAVDLSKSARELEERQLRWLRTRQLWRNRPTRRRA